MYVSVFSSDVNRITVHYHTMFVVVDLKGKEHSIVRRAAKDFRSPETSRWFLPWSSLVSQPPSLATAHLSSVPHSDHTDTQQTEAAHTNKQPPLAGNASEALLVISS